MSESESNGGQIRCCLGQANVNTNFIPDGSTKVCLFRVVRFKSTDYILLYFAAKRLKISD